MNDISIWIRSDKILANLLAEIEKQSDDLNSQAEIAVNKLSIHFDLPQTPDQLAERYEYYDELEIDDPRSVYEEFALLRYLNPEADLRAIALRAIYNVKNFRYTDLDSVVEKKWGFIPKESYVQITGDLLTTSLRFSENPDESADWNVMYKVFQR